MAERRQTLDGVEERVLPVSPNGSIRAQWSAYRLRRNLALFLLFGWMPMALGVFLLSRLWLHEPILSLGAIIGWWIAACGMIWWAGEFRCPRCRRRYGAVGSRKGVSVIWRGLFDPICNNCKLRKFEDFNAEGSNPGSLDRRVVRG